MLLDRWAAAILAPLTLWVLLNAIDDLFLDVAWLCQWLFSRRPTQPSDEERQAVAQQRMAIFVPAWREHAVIRHMVEHNVAAQRYGAYDIFIGVYPNDAATCTAASELEERFANLHVARCPHPGPTSKADCLNWIYQRMLLFEEEQGVRFDMVLTHDAEDLIHPEALRTINYWMQGHDMVQIPVLALQTPWYELTHGTYCDEFAQFQFRDMPVRQMLGGFVPSNGVGAAFSRKVLERMAAESHNQIFEPECLTEDYENGFRVHSLGGRQMFVPIHRHNGSFVATREFFPRKFRAAVRQRTRWVTGIALQSWERHGWRESLGQLYWLWRDRRGLVGSLVTPLANLLFVYGAGTLGWSTWTGTRWGLAHAQVHPAVTAATLALEAFHLGMRVCCSAKVYGWGFAAGVPLRLIWGNAINLLAVASAMARFATAKWQGKPLVWLKTEHAYPNRMALVEHRRGLEEILVGSAYLDAETMARALASKSPGTSLAAHLLKLGVISERDMYEAISLQENVPLGKPAQESVSVEVTRTFPVEMAKKWRVLPYRVADGHLHIVGSEPPNEAMHLELAEFSSLEIRFQLVTPTDFGELAREYLPE